MTTQISNSSNKRLRFPDLNKNDVIRADNVRARAEIIAIRAFKGTIARGNRHILVKAFYNLLDDIDNFDVLGYVLTDSYEIVQEASMFLYEHIGKRITDLVIDRQGNPITILRACFKIVNMHIMRMVRRVKKKVFIDEDYPRPQFKVEFDWDAEEPDYTAVNEKIKAMNLTERQSVVLDYRMTGTNYTDIGQILFENNKRKTAAGKVRDTVAQIREKYTRLFIEHKPLNNPFQPDAIFYQADFTKLNLTPTQHKVIEVYLRGERLSDIARTFSVSRQAAWDAINKTRIKIKKAQTVREA